MTTTTTPSGVKATTDLAAHAELAKKLEAAFYLAAQRFPYWSVALSALTPVIVEIPKSHPSYESFTFAVTEGLTMIVSTRVLDLGWTNQEIATVLCHELMHPWQRHAARAKALGINRADPNEAALWNIAADMEINDDLRDAGCVFPALPDGKPSGCYPESIGAPLYLTAEEYYALLKQKQDEQPQQGGGKDGKGEPGGGGKKGGGGTGPMNPDGCGGGAGNESGIERELGLGEGGDDPLGADKAEESVEAIAGRMDNALDQAEADPRMQGKIPKGLALEAAKRRKRSSIDWKAQLSRVVRRAVEQVKGERQVNWSRLSRRTFGKFAQPTHTDPQIKVMVVMDTSGSMVGMLPVALEQVRSVLEAARASVTWVQCDAAIAEVVTIKNVADVDRIMLKGGGGTDFRPPFTLAEKMPARTKPSVVVYITDGYGQAPSVPPSFKTIWAMLGGDRAPASWGSTVLIPQEV